MKSLKAGILAIAIVAAGIAGTVSLPNVRAAGSVPKEIVLPKSTGNPMLGFNNETDRRYGGDPSVLVDGDTVYAYVGQDDGVDWFHMTKYLCYSSKDMINWKYESVAMEANTISWAKTDNTAWASQVAKHKGKYYLYYCTTDKTQPGDRQSIGCAVSDTPTGPFEDIGKPLVQGSKVFVQYEENGVQKYDASNEWKDIDPTVWIETDERGEERRYLGWGNVFILACELNEDMISIKDTNGDGVGDEKDVRQSWLRGNPPTESFTEAAWFYRQQDEKGNYFGKYYMFYAGGYREQMCYATSDDLMGGEWQYGGLLMEPTPTSGTNHMAVCDFKGKTYFVYHNGSLAGGSGSRRVACVEEFCINKDGTIDMIQETATGLAGVSSKISNRIDGPIAHEAWRNPLDDGLNITIGRKVGCDHKADILDARWEINPGKVDKTNQAYVSIESYNKPGLFLAVSGKDVVLSHDHDGSKSTSESMTFRTLDGLAGYGVTFESVSTPGYYLTSEFGKLKISNTPDPLEATFEVEADTVKPTVVKKMEILEKIEVLKKVRTYKVGEALNTDDIRIIAIAKNGNEKEVTKYTTNAKQIDMNKAGDKVLTVTYTEGGITKSADIKIHVVDLKSVAPVPIQPAKPTSKVPAKNSTHKIGRLKYKVTLSDAKKGTVAVTGAKKKTYKKVLIPANVKINGYTFKVSSISAEAFVTNKKLKTITIGTNVKSIGKNAFKGINKKATFTVPKSRYKTVKKLLKSKTGFKKSMTIKTIK